MTQKRLLISGSSGYLGQVVTAKATEQFTLFSAYRSGYVSAGKPIFLDLTDRAIALETIAALSPQAIIHTAAINPGQADIQTMEQVNVGGSAIMAEAALAAGARLVHVSTDVVHDGRHAPYDDAATPNPLNDYGRTKAEAEAVVMQINPGAAIVRTSLIYGLQQMDRGTEGFVARLESGQPLVLFSDVIRQPVWVDSLAEALLKLVNLDYAGTLNVAGEQALTREDFGRKMLAWWGIAADGKLQSGRAADISDTIPLDLRLTIDRAQTLLGLTLPGVDAVVGAGR